MVWMPHLNYIKIKPINYLIHNLKWKKMLKYRLMVTRRCCSVLRSWSTSFRSSFSLLPVTWSFSWASSLSSVPSLGCSWHHRSWREACWACLPRSSSCRSCTPQTWAMMRINAGRFKLHVGLRCLKLLLSFLEIFACKETQYCLKFCCLQ